MLMEKIRFYNTTEVAQMYGYTQLTIIKKINNGYFGEVRKGNGKNGRFILSDKNLKHFDSLLMTKK